MDSHAVSSRPTWGTRSAADTTTRSTKEQERRQPPSRCTPADHIELLGLQIQIGRLRRQMSMADLAEIIGVSVVTIRKLERGHPGVAIGTVYAAASATGVRRFLNHRETAVSLRRARQLRALLPTRVAVLDDI